MEALSAKSVVVLQRTQFLPTASRLSCFPAQRSQSREAIRSGAKHLVHQVANRGCFVGLPPVLRFTEPSNALAQCLQKRRSLLLVYLFATAARASCGARHANASSCEPNYLTAEPTRIAIALVSQASKLLRELLLEASLAIILIISLRKVFGATRAATKRNKFDHLSV